MNVAKMMISIFDRVERLWEKEKMLVTSIYPLFTQSFSSFTQCFQSYFSVAIKVEEFVGKGQNSKFCDSK